MLLCRCALFLLLYSLFLVHLLHAQLTPIQEHIFRFEYSKRRHFFFCTLQSGTDFRHNLNAPLYTVNIHTAKRDDSSKSDRYRFFFVCGVWARATSSRYNSICMMMWITAWINYPTLFRCIIHYSTIFVLSCCGAAHRTAILYCIFRYPTDNCHCTQDRHAVEVSLAHRLYTYVMIMHIFFFPWRHANVYHFSARPSIILYREIQKKTMLKL